MSPAPPGPLFVSPPVEPAIDWLRHVEVLDNLKDLSGWIPVVSRLGQLTSTPERGPWGAVMRLDFDFRGGGGFVIARGPLAPSGATGGTAMSRRAGS